MHDAEEGKLSCPNCGSGDVDLVEKETILICLDCGYEGKK